ncbi:hypothetical protein L1887_38782 [Cichorium endivia]|nr:hypothetical protein L1887_38782 [Cichorium endivia]
MEWIVLYHKSLNFLSLRFSVFCSSIAVISEMLLLLPAEDCERTWIGFEIVGRATAGGGGRGMRLAKECVEFVKLLQSEAVAAFGNDGVYLEKYIQNLRHIEFQVLADKYVNVVHFGERDCSIQKRNQKLLEEAPSAAFNWVHWCWYVEFLLDERGS